ncbi:WD40/YVTN/BNR-like repeat-containing protein [Paracidobacterium acidisoli]|uniref:WD40/YVTN/BNR-like repeat-containing protein n=1 Tax=Paracidobacterium acidisoli TaxID=2303751 RepID=UPI0020797537|nr:transcriptional regulator [Paracidobacterium acidisoli]
MSLFLLALVVPAHAAETWWPSVGPDGGDARSFASDPSSPGHLYLGTTNGWIYASSDAGASWSRLARLDGDDDLVVDSLVVDESDAKTLIAGVWELGHAGGGVYISQDSGVTWTPSAPMKGQSVLALAQAPSNPKVLVAGTLSGVYRSEDKGAHWSEISPPGSTEVHEVESIAIDPYDPHTIYAGTWHLPWKTTDGGRNWFNIHKGVIDDSDVFSIVIDPSRPSVVFASACSGIYRTDDGGSEFRKVQGIPSTARRTRVLMMDPKDRNTVYAGTTEGLYKTTDGGTNWTRTTGPDVIINDVYIDPRDPKHVVLATDRSGVLSSEDAGATFEASNAGFSQRQVAALLTGSSGSDTMYAGVVNDKTYGGVFASSDGGHTWKQQSSGLDGRDVFSLAQTTDGTLLAGTSRGIFRWNGSAWMPSGTVASVAAPAEHRRSNSRNARTNHRGRHAPPSAAPVAAPDAIMNGRIHSLSLTGDVWYAATSGGVYRSTDQGNSWQATTLAATDYTLFAVNGSTVFAGRRVGMMVSHDAGRSWELTAFPRGLSSLQALLFTPDGTLWAGGREGIFYSTDQGHTWTFKKEVPVVAVNGLSWDSERKRVIVTSSQTTLIFAVPASGGDWKWWNTGWKVHTVRSLNGHMVAASLYNGVVMQPEHAAEGTPVAVNAKR